MNKSFLLICVLNFSWLTIINAQNVPAPLAPKTGPVTYLSSVKWNKQSSTDYTLYNEDNIKLEDLKELGYLSSDTLAVIHKPSRTLVLLPNFENSLKNINIKGHILKRNISKNFYITNPQRYKAYVDDVVYTSTSTFNTNGNYLMYFSELDKSYVANGIRKFKSWGAKDLIELEESPGNVYWYRDVEKKEYGIVEKGNAIDYSEVTSKFSGDDFIVTYKNEIEYKLLNYSNTPSLVFKPIEFEDIKSNTGCVSGDCTNGWGKYEFNNGYYEGFWENGKRNSYGLYTWQDAGSYIGLWKNDNMNGYGVYTAKNKDIQKGEFKDGRLDGLGISTSGDKWVQGIYAKGSLSTGYDFYSNDEDIGCTVGDCTNEYGRFLWENGDSFTGFFKGGKLLLGTYSFANGNKYSGMFNSNQYNGMGRFFFSDGSYYGGEWKNGSYNGKGYFTDGNGSIKIGLWENGVLVKSYSN
ncbi:MAG: hypothetical protein V7719_03340 [Psychroserpens sp.]|uniref:MORN repeat-containing protein n=1 Tax=Psychroserpens sp. TaxID=2020870 RepID=UPI003001E5F0